MKKPDYSDDPKFPKSLYEALSETGARTEAAEVLRNLIENVRVSVLEVGFEIKLIGEIANMVDLANSSHSKKKPLQKGGRSRTVPEFGKAGIGPPQPTYFCYISMICLSKAGVSLRHWL